MKKIIALTLALTFVLSTAGCGNSKEDETLEKTESASVIETSQSVTGKEEYTYVNRAYEDISFQVRDDFEHEYKNSWDSDTGEKFVIKIIEDAVSSTDEAELQTSLDNYANSDNQQIIKWVTIDGNEAIVTSSYGNTNILFFVGTKLYTVICSNMEDDEVSKLMYSIKIHNVQTQPATEPVTETQTESQNNGKKTSEDIDEIERVAKERAKNATTDEVQQALDTLKALSGHFFDNEANMYSAMYNGFILYHYFKGTDSPYEQAGFYAVASVKYVYRGIDTQNSKDTADNLIKFAGTLNKCGPIEQYQAAGSASASSSYGEGMYKVGVDIPAGEYCVYAESDKYGGYYCVSSDSTGDSIIGNDNFDYNAFVTVVDGEYIELSRAYAVPVTAIDGTKYSINTSGTGTFRIGIDLPAGEYVLTSEYEDLHGYVCVYNDSRPDADIVTNDNFKGKKYITVFDGQYLLINRCKIS